jgi:hypothetical protein
LSFDFDPLAKLRAQRGGCSKLKENHGLTFFFISNIAEILKQVQDDKLRMFCLYSQQIIILLMTFYYPELVILNLFQDLKNAFNSKVIPFFFLSFLPSSVLILKTSDPGIVV